MPSSCSREEPSLLYQLFQHLPFTHTFGNEADHIVPGHLTLTYGHTERRYISSFGRWPYSLRPSILQYCVLQEPGLYAAADTLDCYIKEFIGHSRASPTLPLTQPYMQPTTVHLLLSTFLRQEKQTERNWSHYPSLPYDKGLLNRRQFITQRVAEERTPPLSPYDERMLNRRYPISALGQRVAEQKTKKQSDVMRVR